MTQLFPPPIISRFLSLLIFSLFLNTSTWAGEIEIVRASWGTGKNSLSHEFVQSLSKYLTTSSQQLDKVKFYDFFTSCPYRETNVTKQKEFRTKLIEAFEKAVK